MCNMETEEGVEASRKEDTPHFFFNYILNLLDFQLAFPHIATSAAYISHSSGHIIQNHSLLANYATLNILRLKQEKNHLSNNEVARTLVINHTKEAFCHSKLRCSV